MNTVRIGLISLCAAAGVSAWLSLRDTQTREAPASQATRAPVNPFTASAPGSSASSAENSSQRAALAMNEASELREVPDDSDAIDTPAPTVTIDELLDALDASIGEGGEPIDREAVGASLRADPVLTRTLDMSGPAEHAR